MVVARASGMDLASILKRNTFLTLGVRPARGPGSARDGGTEKGPGTGGHKRAPGRGAREGPRDGGPEKGPRTGGMSIAGNVFHMPGERRIKFT